MGPQSRMNPNFENLRTPKKKWHLGVGPMTMHRGYYKGEGGGFPPSLRCGESCEFEFARGSFVHQECSNYALTNLLFGLCKFVWIIDLLVARPNPHPRALARLSTTKVLRAKECTLIFYPSIVFTFGLAIEFIKEFGGASQSMSNHNMNSTPLILFLLFNISIEILTINTTTINVW